MNLCKVPDCGQIKRKRSTFCENHFNRPLCLFEGCDLKVKIGDDLCPRHVANRDTFSLTTEEFLTFKKQKICDICNKEKEILVIDHDHDHCPAGSGCKECIRGMLCSGCNYAIGCFRDDPINLIKAIGYLKKVRTGHFKEYV